MRSSRSQWSEWDEGNQGEYTPAPSAYYEDEQYAGDDDGFYPAGDFGDDERGLVLQPEQSLVNVSSTVTQHGVPLLSYTRTMQRFYTNRKQRLSFGRFKCEVCGERIRFWAWETTTKSHTHDGCYERLAWTWTSLYAHQQHLASEGNFE
ncbi:MAG: hypothetical protein ACHQ4H_02705 [Ktedonobacterales bacterium]